MITVEEVNAIIQQYGPVFKFHPDEMYLPDAPVPFLAAGACTLGWGLITGEDDYDAFKEQGLGLVGLLSQDALAAAVAKAKADPNANKSDSFRYWLNIHDSLKGGNLDRAAAQVCVKRGVTDDVVNIQFWMFYGYNGPGKIHITFGNIINQIVFLKESGIHYGDWEHVTLVCGRDASAPAGWKIKKVYLSRHDLTIWVQDPSTLSYQGTHPIIYVAKDSHAHYESAGTHNYKRIAHKDYFVGHLDVDLFDMAADQGRQFDVSAAGHADIVFSDYPEHGVTPPAWWSFDARWGQYTKEFDDVKVAIPVYGDYSYPYKSVESGPKGPVGHVPSGLSAEWAGAMGQGTGAVQWLVGDFNGDGKDEIVQAWGGDLNFIMYGSDGYGGIKTLWTGAMGQGTGAVQWLVGDFNGDGKDEIVQAWGGISTSSCMAAMAMED
ncbi:Vps62-related protein [Pseudomonas batumici]|uniref:Vps62-related protein n=1 Tax=Pseudomonas batumici TaxID=226910 RepID=UPI0030D0F687